MDWIKNNLDIRPNLGEDVLCDFGEGTHFVVLTYNGGNSFEDLASGNIFDISDFCRWAYIGAHL